MSSHRLILDITVDNAFCTRYFKKAVKLGSIKTILIKILAVVSHSQSYSQCKAVVKNVLWDLCVNDFKGCYSLLVIIHEWSRQANVVKMLQ